MQHTPARLGMEEWIRIGDDINIVFLGMSQGQAKLMIDAPREIPVVRSRAQEKYLSAEEYRKKREEIARKVERSKNGKFVEGCPVEFALWLKEEKNRYATFGIYGKGKLARACYNAILTGGTQRILAYVNPQRARYDMNVFTNDESALANPAIDHVIVAIPDEKNYRGAVHKLLDLGVELKKMMWVPEA